MNIFSDRSFVFMVMRNKLTNRELLVENVVVRGDLGRIFVLCVGVCGSCESMEYSDEEGFVLTQQSVKEYEDTPSYDFGDNIIDDEGVVSLEAVGEPNFELGYDGLNMQSQNSARDGIAIEEISDDEVINSL